MMSMKFINAVTAFLALASYGRAAPANLAKRNQSELSLTTKLQLADSAVARYALLPNDEDFVYDFSQPRQIPVADRKSFPPLVGTGGSLAIGDLPGCSMSLLHTHPLADELFAVVTGRILTEMVPETGVVDAEGNQRVIRTDLSAGMMTVFPAGALHTQFNPGCEPASTAVSFTTDDFRIGLVANEVLALSDDIIARTFGQAIAGEDIDTIRDAIPTGMAIMVEECLATCGRQKRSI